MKINKFLMLCVLFLLSFNIQANCIKGNCENGSGVWLEKNDSYVGQFKDGKRHGQGVEHVENGSEYRIYNGGFENGYKSGTGIVYIYNGKDNSYLFGNFKNDNFADGSEVLMKLESGLEIYYRAEVIGSGSSSLKIIEEKTRNLFCSRNPTYIGCINKFVWENKETIFALMAVGYISSVVNSDSSMSFNDITQGIKTLADTIRKRRDERTQEFAERVARKLGLAI